MTCAVPIHTPDGSVAGWFGTNTDISEHQQTQQQLQALNQELAATTEELAAANEEIQASNEELRETNGQLVRINEDLDNFVYTASHDLKAPITNIEGLMQALLRQLPAQSLAPERVQRIVGLSQESVERFQKTLLNLSDVVKLQQEYNQEAVLVSLPEVVQDVLRDLDPVIRASGVDITVKVDDCPVIRFSEKNMRSVVYNLVSNALKYRSPERVPQVGITCQTNTQYHVLIVMDNGLGLEAGRLSQLFTMFKRFHSHVEGAGIGLFMVKKMVENAGGRIEAESQVGVGSTFRVYFPR